MPTRIRLQRFGKKKQPFYRIVVADSRSPRDGKFIENLGIYNPMTSPVTIDLNIDQALYWLQVGAQPSDTVKSLLSYKGVLYKNHLQKGVTKGALTQEQANLKFNEWLDEKTNRINKKIADKERKQRENSKIILQKETEIKEKRAAALAEKRAKEAASKVVVENTTPIEVAEENSAADSE